MIEDDSNAAELLRGIVENTNMSALISPDGETALEILEKCKPCLILLDILLPKMSGWQVLEKVKSQAKTRYIPVIVVSVTEDCQLGFSKGVFDWFVKPVNKKELVSAMEKARAIGGAPCRNVLVIEDDSDQVEIIGDMLRNEGYRVASALTGQSGLAKAFEIKPDVIILDILLPDMTGFEIVEKLQRQNITRDIPILIHTAKDLTLKEKEYLNQNSKIIVQKNYGEKALLKVINQAALGYN